MVAYKYTPGAGSRPTVVVGVVPGLGPVLVGEVGEVNEVGGVDEVDEVESS